MNTLQSLFWPVLFFITGIVCSFYDIFTHFGVLLSVITGGVILAAILWILVYRESENPLVYLFCLLLFFTMAYGITAYQKNQYDRLAGELSENPHPTGTISEINHYQKMDRLKVRLPSEHWWIPSHYFNINLLGKSNLFSKGQMITINHPLQPITSSANPFTFQAREYWRLQNTSHEIFLFHASDIQIVRSKPPSFIDKVREKAVQRIEDLYPNTSQAGIIKALLLGQKEAVAKVDKEDFRKAGLMHILAVSGLHVGIIAALLFIFLLPVKLHFPDSGIHFILFVSALWLYAALTGMNTPVVRAVILMCFYLTARRIDRQINKWNIYFWAVLLVLTIHPMSLFTVSFQLSFGAVASILLFFKTLHDRVSPILGQNYFSGLVAVSLAAQLGVLPFLLFHFQEFSMVSTLSSFLVLPLLFPLIFMVSISLIIPDSLHILAAGISHLSSIIIELITRLSGILAGWNISSQIWVFNKTTLIFLILALVLAGLYLESKRYTLGPWLLTGSIICLILSGVREGINIYQKRSNCVIVVYKNSNQPITDLYYHGVAYTNYKQALPASIIRNRKKFYIEKTTFLSDEDQWEKLLHFICVQSDQQDRRMVRTILVNDYNDSRKYVVNLSSPSGRSSADGVRDYFPVGVFYNSEK